MNHQSSFKNRSASRRGRGLRHPKRGDYEHGHVADQVFLDAKSHQQSQRLLPLKEHACFLTITNAQPPYTNYTVFVTNAAGSVTTAGSVAILSFQADTDGDGMSDSWETGHGLAANNATDHSLDRDGDGMLNWQEYVAGTNPTDPNS